jgi:gamma-glutamylcyclotransferase (GGCT)/AIG2-like uncharacterized protein YtfP
MTLMFAYGSNLNLEQMEHRCPDAQAIGRLKLDGWRLVFRGVADVIREDGAVCYGGVWRITPRCERALDVYEGISSGMYRKEYIPIKPTPEGEREMLVYVMNSTGIMPPSAYYLDVIREGYRDFGMPRAARAALNRALAESWDDKSPSHIERQRYRRNGRPRLAQRPKTPAAPVVVP